MANNGRANGDVSSPGSIDSDVSEDTTWISWFSQLKGNEFFCEVEEEFIQDDFNLTGLSSQVTYYNYALDTILDVDIPEGELDDRQQEMVEVSAETLYGLIHARYILTARGMDAMRTKYIEGSFGRCPRVYCKGQHVLPVGISDLPRCSTVKIFCPMCWDLFFPRARSHNNLDGAYWGTTFPHIFLHTYHSLVPQRNKERYTPKIYGFKIHHTAVQVERNRGPDNSNSNPFNNNNNSGPGGNNNNNHNLIGSSHQHNNNNHNNSNSRRNANNVNGNATGNRHGHINEQVSNIKNEAQVANNTRLLSKRPVS